MKGFLYTIIFIIILAVAGIIYVGKTAPAPEAETDIADIVPTDETSVRAEEATSTPEETEEESVRTISLSAANFAFSEREIRVKKGERVRVELSITEGFHDFVIDEFSARTDRGSEGDTLVVEFVADRAGEFPFYCSVGNHRSLGMEGTFIVEEEGE